MLKSLSALAIFGFLGAVVIALPGFAPQVEASETVALAKGDRLPVERIDGNCSKQVWPTSKPIVCEIAILAPLFAKLVW
jgi:hypothetical protein